MAFDGEFLWTANPSGQNLNKIRASDGVVVGSYGYGPFPRGIAFDGAYIWVSTENDNVLHKIRPSDGAQLGSVGVGAYPIRLLAVNGTIWTVNYQGGSVTKVASDGTVLAEIAVGGYPHAITTDGTSVYVTSQANLSISKIDIASGTKIAEFPLDILPDGIGFDGVSLWASMSSTSGISMRKLDPANGSVLLAIGPSMTSGTASTIAFPADGGVWATNFATGYAQRFDLQSGALLEEIFVSSGCRTVLAAGGYLWFEAPPANTVFRY